METQAADTSVDVAIVDDTPQGDAAMTDDQILDRALSKGSEPEISDSNESDASDEVDVDPVDEEKESKDDDEDESEDAPQVDEEKEKPAKPTNGDASKETKDDIDEEDGYEPNLTVHGLQKLVKSVPELKVAFEKNPAIQRQFFYTARRAERADKYDGMFQTPALAQEMKAAAEREYGRRELFEGDSEKFLQAMLLDSFEKDSEGRVRLDANQQPISNGAYERHMGHYRNSWYDAVESAARNVGDQSITIAGETYTGADILEAVKILKAVTENHQNAEVGAAQSKDLPADVQAKLAELEALKKDSQAKDTQSLSEFKNSTEVAARSEIETMVKNLLAKRLPENAAYNEYMRSTIVEKTTEIIWNLAKQNRAHQEVLNRAIRSIPGAERNANGVEKIVNYHKSYAKELIGRELGKVLTKATSTVVASAGANKNKVQSQQNRKEVQASGGVAHPSRPDVKREAHRIESEARAKGKHLSDMELLDGLVQSTTRR